MFFLRTNKILAIEFLIAILFHKLNTLTHKVTALLSLIKKETK